MQNQCNANALPLMPTTPLQTIYKALLAKKGEMQDKNWETQKQKDKKWETQKQNDKKIWNTEAEWQKNFRKKQDLETTLRQLCCKSSKN